MICLVMGRANDHINYVRVSHNDPYNNVYIIHSACYVCSRHVKVGFWRCVQKCLSDLSCLVMYGSVLSIYILETQ